MLVAVVMFGLGAALLTRVQEPRRVRQTT
jgi:hypothetical protein